MEAFIGQIIMFGGNFAPRNWAFCDGQLISITSNEALFSILGTTYGGDGRTTFGLPDLRGRVPKHAGGSNGPGLNGVKLGQKGGREQHQLSVNEMPSHSHTATLHAELTIGVGNNPKGNMLAAPSASTLYSPSIPADNVDMATESVTLASSGGGQAFALHGPYTGINFIIALEGIFPPRS